VNRARMNDTDALATSRALEQADLASALAGRDLPLSEMDGVMSVHDQAAPGQPVQPVAVGTWVITVEGHERGQILGIEARRTDGAWLHRVWFKRRTYLYLTAKRFTVDPDQRPE
jgi:hypothetical protein